MYLSDLTSAPLPLFLILDDPKDFRVGLGQRTQAFREHRRKILLSHVAAMRALPISYLPILCLCAAHAEMRATESHFEVAPSAFFGSLILWIPQ